MAPNSLTTHNFDSQFNNKISTYATDNTFSWIITQPLVANYKWYFIKELVTQAFVAAFLAILLSLTKALSLKSRMLIIFIAGAAAVTATYIQLMNWWGIPPNYGIGVSFNLIAGWLLAGFISAKFILKSKSG